MSLNVAAHFQKHCPGCFQLKGGVAICRHCGYDESAPRSPLFLPHGTLLSGHYRVGRVLGRPGGFGITYLGWDVNLQQRVAIKEYLPRAISQRIPQSLAVDVHTSEDRRGFEFGKEQFLREARLVAKLDHANIVRVRNFFNANATAYLVMDYYEGMSLGDYLSSVRNKLEPELAVPLIKPILEGLQYVHERGLVHRDLKPHNIYLAAVGRPIVLDFGAARQTAGDRVQSLSVVLTEGYAPLEQYQRRAVQGPWTDIYGVGATLYRMITGAAPPIALDRIGRDPLEEGGWHALPASLVPTMRMALAVRASDRYQSAAEFRAALDRFISGAQPTSAAAVAAIIPAATAFIAPIAEATEQLTAEIPAPVLPSVPPARVDRLVAAAALRATPTPTPTPTPQLSNALPTATWPLPPPPRVAVAAEAAAQTSPMRTPSRPAVAQPSVTTSGLDVRVTAPDEQPVWQLRAPPRHPAPSLRAIDAAAVSQAPTNASAQRWLAWLLLAVGGLVIAYLLLNSPGLALAAKLAVAPLPASTPTSIAATAAAAGLAASSPVATPARVPTLVPVPSGSVLLTAAAADTAVSEAGKSVHITAFKMGKTEVTVAEFRDFVQRTGYDNPRWQNYPCESSGGRLPDWQNPGYAHSDQSPVVCVSWIDATAYSQWLTRETGRHFRLPTEAEWEYAARAHSDGRYWWGNATDSGNAVCQSCLPKLPTQPVQVASLPPNPFGLYEILGNVREWTCSVYQPYSSSAAEQCGSVAEGARVAVRGGSWQQSVDTLAANYREAYEPYRRNTWTGFRVAEDGHPADASRSR